MVSNDLLVGDRIATRFGYIYAYIMPKFSKVESGANLAYNSEGLHVWQIYHWRDRAYSNETLFVAIWQHKGNFYEI
jgi:hypothetical protein